MLKWDSFLSRHQTRGAGLTNQDVQQQQHIIPKTDCVETKDLVPFLRMVVITNLFILFKILPTFVL